jgi:hypothetical protein
MPTTIPPNCEEVRVEKWSYRKQASICTLERSRRLGARRRLNCLRVPANWTGLLVSYAGFVSSFVCFHFFFLMFPFGLVREPRLNFIAE